jgi:hypothetical protein
VALPAGESQPVEVGVQAKPFQFVGLVAIGLKEAQRSPEQGRQISADGRPAAERPVDRNPLLLTAGDPDEGDTLDDPNAVKAVVMADAGVGRI